MKTKSGFTLIELLIVVAIIAILAAIAVPNFLEAQTRAKVSRSVSDMRSLGVALESYRVDYGTIPRPWRGTAPQADAYWWGFVPMMLTTPISYINSWPLMPFTDTSVTAIWKNATGGTGTAFNQSYTYVFYPHQFTANFASIGGTFKNAGKHGIPADARFADAGSFIESVNHAGYILYTAGPDSVDSIVWVSPITYDPSNGTLSFGDVCYFGQGSRDESASRKEHWANSAN